MSGLSIKTDVFQSGYSSKLEAKAKKEFNSNNEAVNLFHSLLNQYIPKTMDKQAKQNALLDIKKDIKTISTRINETLLTDSAKKLLRKSSSLDLTINDLEIVNTKDPSVMSIPSQPPTDCDPNIPISTNSDNITENTVANREGLGGLLVKVLGHASAIDQILGNKTKGGKQLLALIQNEINSVEGDETADEQTEYENVKSYQAFLTAINLIGADEKNAQSISRYIYGVDIYLKLEFIPNTEHGLDFQEILKPLAIKSRSANGFYLRDKLKEYVELYLKKSDTSTKSNTSTNNSGKAIDSEVQLKKIISEVGEKLFISNVPMIDRFKSLQQAREITHDKSENPFYDSDSKKSDKGSSNSNNVVANQAGRIRIRELFTGNKRCHVANDSLRRASFNVDNSSTLKAVNPNLINITTQGNLRLNVCTVGSFSSGKLKGPYVNEYVKKSAKMYVEEIFLPPTQGVGSASGITGGAVSQNKQPVGGVSGALRRDGTNVSQTSTVKLGACADNDDAKKLLIDVRFLALSFVGDDGQLSIFEQHRSALRQAVAEINADKNDPKDQIEYLSFGINVGNKWQKFAKTGLNEDSIPRLLRRLDVVSRQHGENGMDVEKQFALDKLAELLKDNAKGLTRRRNAPTFIACLALLQKELNIEMPDFTAVAASSDGVADSTNPMDNNAGADNQNTAPNGTATGFSTTGRLMIGCKDAKDRTTAVLLGAKIILELIDSVKSGGREEINKLFKDNYINPNLEEAQRKIVINNLRRYREFLQSINEHYNRVPTNINFRVLQESLFKYCDWIPTYIWESINLVSLK